MVSRVSSRKLRLAYTLAIIVIASGFTLLLAREAIADFRFSNNHPGCCGSGFNEPDYGGRVPEASGRPRNGSRDCVLGLDSVMVTTYPPPNYRSTYQHSIEYDWPEMRNSNPTDAAYTRLKSHERYHSMGWAHGERPASRNKAYSRTIKGTSASYC